MSAGAAFLASLLVTLGRPAWWLLALATFTVRGGFVLFLVPIVVLPSPLALSNLVGPFVVAVAFGRTGGEMIAVTLVAIGLLLAWLLVGGWLAAAVEIGLIRQVAEAATDEGAESARGVPPAGPATARDRRLARRMLAARLLASIPLVAAIGLGLVGIVAVVYEELTRPSDAAASLVARVAVGAVGQLVAIALAWCAAEVVGGLACRRIVLDRVSVLQGVRGAMRDIVARPGSVVLWLLTSAWLFVVVAIVLFAAGIAWSGLLAAMSARLRDPALAVMTLVMFVSIWLAALIITGLFAAIRSSAMTFELVRRRSGAGLPGALRQTVEHEGTGTFGASTHHRPGDWSLPDDRGSL